MSNIFIVELDILIPGEPTVDIIIVGESNLIKYLSEHLVDDDAIPVAAYRTVVDEEGILGRRGMPIWERGTWNLVVT